jgi:hypothetical protein
MKYRIIYYTALLALATSAHAITAAKDDLVLGFSASGGTGAAVNLEVDLGNVAQFYNTSGTLTLTGLKNADLVSTYGSNWDTRVDLTWGVVGTTGAAVGTTVLGNTIASKTLWGTEAETTLGLQSTGWNRGTTNNQQGSANTIATLYNGGLGSLTNASATGNSATAAVISNSLAGSWTLQEGGISAFGYFNPKSSFENGTNISSGSWAASDLYELQPANGTPLAVYLGTFALSSDGVLTYGDSYSVATAVPEPSTYAVILGAVTLGFVALRRHQRAVKV